MKTKIVLDVEFSLSHSASSQSPNRFTSKTTKTTLEIDVPKPLLSVFTSMCKLGYGANELRIDASGTRRAQSPEALAMPLKEEVT